jgi:hypothetical protein
VNTEFEEILKCFSFLASTCAAFLLASTISVVPGLALTS